MLSAIKDKEPEMPTQNEEVKKNEENRIRNGIFVQRDGLVSITNTAIRQFTICLISKEAKLYYTLHSFYRYFIMLLVTKIA